MTCCAKCNPAFSTGERLILCQACFSRWVPPKSLEEYLQKPYKPYPVTYPAGYGTAEDFPE